MISVFCGIIHAIVDIQVKCVLCFIFLFFSSTKGKKTLAKKLSSVNEK